MVEAVAFCPMTPLLVPEVAQGAAGELDELRDACRQAIRAAHAPGRRWVVLGPGDTSRRYPSGSRGSFARWGVPLLVTLGTGTSAAGEDGPAPTLPLSLTVGAWLLRDALGDDVDATAWSVADASDEALDHWDDDCWVPEGEEVAVLAVGDGSARRTVKAPGYLDERAEPYDRAVAAALSSGEGYRLHLLEDEHGLLAAGAPVWQLLAWTIEAASPWLAEVRYDDAPYGVGYFVASWLGDHERWAEPGARLAALEQRIAAGNPVHLRISGSG